MTNGRIFITDALRWAFDLWKRALPAVWAPLLAVALLTFLSSPVTDLSPALKILVVVLSVPALVVAYGALLRLALADQHPGEGDYRLGPAGLQWNVIETRLLGSILLLSLFFLLAAVGAAFVVMLTTLVVTVVTGASAKPAEALLASPAGVAGGLVLLVAVALILWSGARLTLSSPATVDRRQVLVFSTWKSTEGQVASLLACFAVVLLPGLALSMIANHLQQAAIGAAPGSSLTTPVFAAYALVVGFVQMPFGVGISAYFYRRLQERTNPAL